MKIKIPLLITLLSLLILSGCGGYRAPNSAPVSDTPTAAPIPRPAETTTPNSNTNTSAPTLGDETLRNQPEISNTQPHTYVTDDLWQRVRNGFQFTHSGLPQGAHQQLDWFLARPDYIQRVTERAAPYLHYIVEQIEARNMPSEIALLPIIESGFQPFAYSRSAASGLWQFIPSSGKYYGLAQNHWYDGRRDTIAATDAALGYLQKLNHMFDGDWFLALAAYNAGEGTVGRAIKKNRLAGLPTDFWSLDLPRETRAYVPKLLAISHIALQPEHYNVALHPIENKAYLSIADAKSQIDLALAAQYANISLKELYQLNAGYNRWSTPPSGPHTLLLPLENSAYLQQQLASNAPRFHWQDHTIKSGETLSKIAAKHQVSTHLLKQHNHITRNRLIAGERLIYPAPSAPASAYKTNPDHQLAANRGHSKPKKITHTVKSGDSWWALSRRYGVDMHKLAQWNKATPSRTLRPGQKLVILQGKAAHAAVQKQVRHKVKSGDSLWGIAHRYQVAVNDIKRWNKLGKSLIKPGQKLLINLPR